MFYSIHSRGERLRRLGTGTGLIRLSILTFFLLFGAGAAAPIMGLYFTQYLHLSGGLAGAILSVSALGVVIAPFLGSMVADRLVPAERLLSLCLFGSALLIFLLSKAHSPMAVLILFGGHSLMFGPVLSLNNAVIFHHVENRGGDYGRIRVFGTLGWIAVAWLFSWFWLRGGQGRVLPERLPDALVLSALVYAAMGVFSLFLPPTKVSRGADRPGLLPRDAFAVIVEPEILALATSVFLCILTDRFYYYGAAIFLKQSGFDESRILPVLSLGQFLEIPAMAFLGQILSKLSMKKVLLLGLVCNGCRFGFFTFSSSRPELIFAGIMFHGLTYAFFFSTAFVCLDTFVKSANRAGVHQLFTIFTTGAGTLAGSLLAGLLSQYAVSDTGTTDFRFYWAFCLVVVLVAVICVVFFFKPGTNVPRIAAEVGLSDQNC